MSIIDWGFLALFIFLCAFAAVQIARDARINGFSRKHWYPITIVTLLLAVNVTNVIWSSHHSQGGVWFFAVLTINIILLASIFFWRDSAYESKTKYALSAVLVNRKLHRARRLVRSGRATHARDLLEAANSRRESPYVHNDLALAYEALGECDRAKEHFLRAVEMAPDELVFRENLESLSQEHG